MASTIEAIIDAGLFTVNNSHVAHTLSERAKRENPITGDGGRTLRVSGLCGTWADALDGEHSYDRAAFWASGYVEDDETACETCVRRGGYRVE